MILPPTSVKWLAIFTIIIPTTVHAHGHLHSISIDGTSWAGPDVGVPLAGGSAIRMIDDVSPVTDDSSDDLSCGQGAANEFAQLSATANAGSQIGFYWVNGGGGVWPHNVGPLITYMASCGAGDCSTFPSLNAEWIKIDQAGLLNGSDSEWVQGATIFKGQPYIFTLPTQIPTGNYLMRHEIIALHNAQAVNGAEHYSACIQLTVTGGSQAASSIPTGNEVKIPGAYSPNDPGLLVNVYNPGFTYQFPGPPLTFGVTNGTDGSGGGDDDDGDDTGSDSPGTSESLPPVPGLASHQCRLQRQQQSPFRRRSQPRTISEAMRTVTRRIMHRALDFPRRL